MTDSFASVAAGYHALLAKIDAFNGDHSPGAIWRRAERNTRATAPKVRGWKARAIGLDPEPIHNAIALSGMTPVMFEDAWQLAVALPQPSPCGGMFDTIDDVVLINPKANTAQLMGDRGATHIAPKLAQERLAVTADPKAWARDIALARLEWFHLRRGRARMLKAAPTWFGDVPSALLLAPVKKVRWSDFHASVIDVPLDLRRDVNRAIFAQANLPRVEARA